jgi:hypothetical protein
MKENRIKEIPQSISIRAIIRLSRSKTKIFLSISSFFPITVYPEKPILAVLETIL